MSFTLGALIEQVSGGILELACAPRGLDVEVGEPVIHDPSDASPVHPGDIVLAVGVPERTRDLVALLEDCAGAAAVAVKLEDKLHPDVAAASERTGVAVLVAPKSIVWGQLYTLMRTARSAPRESQGGSGVPIGDLFALANAVAVMVGGATTIEDPQSKVLAYSSGEDPIDDPRRETILGRQVSEPWRKRLQTAGVFRKLWTSEGVVRYAPKDHPELRPRMAVAVRAGGDILGSIWVAEGSRPLGKEAEAALVEAANIAALHLIRHVRRRTSSAAAVAISCGRCSRAGRPPVERRGSDSSRTHLSAWSRSRSRTRRRMRSIALRT